MYVSAVLLPDGKVFETGGGLHNRADPVYEASMFDPTTNTFTPGMATDPVPRTYHSSAFLLPDGRVMAVGNNPGDGTFDMPDLDLLAAVPVPGRPAADHDRDQHQLDATAAPSPSPSTPRSPGPS